MVFAKFIPAKPQPIITILGRFESGIFMKLTIEITPANAGFYSTKKELKTIVGKFCNNTQSNTTN